MRSFELLKVANPKRVTTPTLEKYQYDSISEFVNAVAKGQTLPMGESANTHDDEWFGSSSIPKAIEIIKGFNNKVEEIKTGLQSLKAVQSEWVPEANRISGSTNIAAMLSGVENCRVRLREKQSPSKSVTIYVQMNALSHVSSKNFINKAIAIANMVINLEKAGRRVELYGYSYSQYTKKNGLILIKIKPFGSMMSLGQLYGALAPSTFRRLVFRHLEMYWTDGIRTPEGYGYSLDWNDNPKGTFNIPRSSVFDDLERGVKFVNAILSNDEN